MTDEDAMSQADDLLRLILEQNAQSVASFRPIHVGAPLDPYGPDLRSATPAASAPGSAMGALAPTAQAPGLSLLQRIALGIRVPNTPLSQNRGTARGQLFLRGLAGGFKSAQGYGLGKSGAATGALTPYQELMIENMRADNARAEAAARESERRFGVEQGNQKLNREALSGRTSVDDMRMAQQFEESKRHNRVTEGQAAGRLALSRQRAAAADRRARAFSAAMARWPDELKIGFSAKMREFGTIYDTESDFGSQMYGEAVDNLIEQYRREARGFGYVQKGGSSTSQGGGSPKTGTAQKAASPNPLGIPMP